MVALMIAALHLLTEDLLERGAANATQTFCANK
jgi:hypothetical protein